MTTFFLATIDRLRVISLATVCLFEKMLQKINEILCSFTYFALMIIWI